MMRVSAGRIPIHKLHLATALNGNAQSLDTVGGQESDLDFEALIVCTAATSANHEVYGDVLEADSRV